MEVNEPSRIVQGVPFSDYLPKGYTVDPDFRMPTVSEPPAEPATPQPPKMVVGFDPAVPGVLSYREGDKVTIYRDGEPAVEGILKQRGAPVYMVDGKIVALDAEYHERTYQNYLAWLFDESHIVRGYD